MKKQEHFELYKKALKNNFFLFQQLFVIFSIIIGLLVYFSERNDRYEIYFYDEKENVVKRTSEFKYFADYDGLIEIDKNTTIPINKVITIKKIQL